MTVFSSDNMKVLLFVLAAVLVKSRHKLSLGSLIGREYLARILTDYCLIGRMLDKVELLRGTREGHIPADQVLKSKHN